MYACMHAHMLPAAPAQSSAASAASPASLPAHMLTANRPGPCLPLLSTPHLLPRRFTYPELGNTSELGVPELQQRPNLGIALVCGGAGEGGGERSVLASLQQPCLQASFVRVLGSGGIPSHQCASWQSMHWIAATLGAASSWSVRPALSHRTRSPHCPLAAPTYHGSRAAATAQQRSPWAGCARCTCWESCPRRATWPALLAAHGSWVPTASRQAQSCRQRSSSAHTSRRR